MSDFLCRHGTDIGQGSMEYWLQCHKHLQASSTLHALWMGLGFPCSPFWCFPTLRPCERVLHTTSEPVSIAAPSLLNAARSDHRSAISFTTTWMGTGQIRVRCTLTSQNRCAHSFQQSIPSRRASLKSMLRMLPQLDGWHCSRIRDRSYSWDCSRSAEAIAPQAFGDVARSAA